MRILQEKSQWDGTQGLMKEFLVIIYGKVGERPTECAFEGTIEINGKSLIRPVLTRSFPTKGELNFDRRMALGTPLGAHFTTHGRYIERISAGFESDDGNQVHRVDSR